MGIRVLLVDDHKIFREGLRSMLEKQPDFEVVGEAENGSEACRMAEEFLPDVIIMDIVMPDMNGIEASRQITCKTSKAKIIGLSMHSDVRYATEMLKAGASGFLLKDSAFEELVNAVHTVNEGHIYLNPMLMESMIRDYITLSSAQNLTSVSVLTPREQEDPSAAGRRQVDARYCFPSWAKH